MISPSVPQGTGIVADWSQIKILVREDFSLMMNIYGDAEFSTNSGEPQGRYVDVAGPETQDLVDMARRTNNVLGRGVKLVPTWSGPLGEEMAGNVLLPGENARIAPTTFDQWLAAGAR